MPGSTGVHMKHDAQLTKGIHFVHNTSSMEVIHVTFGIQKLLVEAEAVSGEEVYGSLDTVMVPTQILYSLLYIFIPRAGLPAILT